MVPSDYEDGEEPGAPRSPPSATSPRSPRSAREVFKSVKEAAKFDPLIYKLTNKVNGNGYVGKAKNSYNRMWEHRTGKGMRGRKKGKMQLVDKKIQEYGWDNFEVEILEANIEPSRLLEREAYWMRHWNTKVPNGYNILDPGVEVISMSDPEIRKRWEAANPEGTKKGVETKRKKREDRLAEMDPEQARELRYRLEKEADRNKKRHNGEELAPDGRFLPSAKRQATWARKFEERLSKMTPLEAAKARAKSESQKKYAAANKSKISEKNKSPKNQAYQKAYRAANKDKRVKLGRTAETSG